MAYMFSIQTTCQKEGCKKPRSHRVCNQRNDTMGDYCKKHAEERLDDLERTELRQFRSRDEATDSAVSKG
jgi:hypothetical protein